MNDLENLLNLDGEIFPMENGYWVKFCKCGFPFGHEAKRVDVSKAIPHGIKYSLTLHDKRNQRVVGENRISRVNSFTLVGLEP